MKLFTLAVAVAFTALPAAAQQANRKANVGSAATVKSHMQSQGYKDIHDLHPAPNGQWTGKATQNGVDRTVTVQPNGATTAR